MVPQRNSAPTAAHLSLPAHSKNSLGCSVLSTDYSPSTGQTELTVKTTKRIVKGNTGPLGFLGQWQYCPGHLAVPKHSNPKYWPITGATPTPPQTLWFHSFTANPLQAIPRIGSGSATPQINYPLKIVERYNKYIHNILLLQAGDTVAIQSPLNHRWNIAGKKSSLPFQIVNTESGWTDQERSHLGNDISSEACTNPNNKCNTRTNNSLKQYSTLATLSPNISL